MMLGGVPPWKLTCQFFFTPQMIYYLFYPIIFIGINNSSSQCGLDLEKSWVVKYYYFRLATALFGILVTNEWKEYQYKIHCKNWGKYMLVRTFASIISYEMLNNNYRNLQKEDVNITVNFLLGMMKGDCKFLTPISHLILQVLPDILI